MNPLSSEDWPAFCHASPELVDRYLAQPTEAVDVIIPIRQGSPFWRANLHSFYAQIPIARLLIGDGGMSEAARAALDGFPRVRIIDQRSRVSLGYCIRELVEQVQTEWFVYLHDDVCLPDGWFEVMARHQEDYDWFECERRKAVLAHYVDARQNAAKRPYSGSQMGRKDAFQPFLARIDDDYLYRNEDLVLRSLVEAHGGRYGRIQDTYHCHQHVLGGGDPDPDVIAVTVARVVHPEREAGAWDMQARGIIKYSSPDRSYLVRNVQRSISRLRQHNLLDAKELIGWTARTNPSWLPYVRAASRRSFAIRGELAVIARSLSRIGRLFFPGPSGSGGDPE